MDTVLLVDDNVTNLKVLSQSLAGMNLTLLIARSGEQALEVAAEAHPALILLDVNMPGIGGFETCRRLKADPATANSVVVFLSARVAVEDKVRGLELGAADYIAKPFAVDEVLARVRTHLAQYHERRGRAPVMQKGPDRLRALIKAGESDRLEFKSTLRWNLKAKRAGKEIENAWLKTIVAFLNTDGGVLLVGVDDDGTVLGIEPDRFPNGDRYLLHANNLIRNSIGPDLTPFLDFRLEPLDDKEVLVVECRPAPRPVFLARDREEAFFVRIGPGSRQLTGSETLAYVQSRAEAAASAPDVTETEAPVTVAPRGERILLVDDNTQNLDVLYKTLDGRDHELLVARSGEEALEIAGKALPSLVLLDIMMPPGIDGFETCRRLKADDKTGDIPVIFMSALDEVQDKVRGLELGAVDYIAKPFQGEEVIARVDTHLTIRRLQRDLAERNAELARANELMTSELVDAAAVQQSLLPRKSPATDKVRFAWKYEPCAKLGGDSLDIFRIDENTLGMYVLDVVGHGVPAALLSVSVTHALSRRDPDRPLREPAQIATQLNQLFPMNALRFFTMVYAVLDTRTGVLRYTAAGHPGPLVVRADGSVEALESTGLPVGVLSDATFKENEVTVAPGDRVYLYSDGACEEMSPSHAQFGVERMQAALVENRELTVDATLDTLIESILAWHRGGGLTDDISLVAAEILS